MVVHGLQKKRKRELGRQSAVHLLLGIISLFFIVPLIWMFLSSFKSALEIIRIPPTFIPEKFTFGNYKTIFQRLHFWRYFLNSIIVSVAITVIAMFTSSLAGFVFTKFDFPGRELIFIIFLPSGIVGGFKFLAAKRRRP